MGTILINLDFPETTRDKFKQEKVGTFVHATGQPVAYQNNTIINFADFGVNCATSNRQ